MQFLLYLFCGGIGVAADYFIYYSAITFGLWYQSANFLGYLSGTLISFFLNRKITFGVNDNMIRRLSIFIGVAVVGFLASSFLLWLMIDVISISAEISKAVTLPNYLFKNLDANEADARLAKLLTLPIVVIIQFSLNRQITFK